MKIPEIEYDHVTRPSVYSYNDKQANGDCDTRQWVREHTQLHILTTSRRLSRRRPRPIVVILSRLPFFGLFAQCDGCPPLPRHGLVQLRADIADAETNFQRNVDADWRASCVKYPEVLDFFWSLVEIKVPSDYCSPVLRPHFEGPSVGDGALRNGLGDRDR